METNLVKQNENYQSIEQIQKLSEIYVQSGLFAGVESFAKAFVKIQAGNEIGIKPFAAMSGIHIISGKPVIGAGIIASRIKASTKYDFTVRELNNTICILDFYEGAKLIGTETFTFDDAKKAETKNIGKFPKNMLFARAISNGIKFYCPDVFDGLVYVPEEMNMETEDVKHEVVQPEMNDTDISIAIYECNTKKELNTLYKKHKEKIDVSNPLKAAAKERQDQLKPVVVFETVEITPPLILDPDIDNDWENSL